MKNETELANEMWGNLPADHSLSIPEFAANVAQAYGDQLLTELPDYPRGASLLEKIRWLVKDHEIAVKRLREESQLAARLSIENDTFRKDAIARFDQLDSKLEHELSEIKHIVAKRKGETR